MVKSRLPSLVCLRKVASGAFYSRAKGATVIRSFYNSLIWGEES
jgi:hypothetical protein